MNTDLRAGLPSLGGANRYRIHAEGRVAQTWIAAFEGMTVAPSVAPDGTSVTTLEGTMPDQAALVGIINSLYDLGLTLVRVEWLAQGG